MIKKIACLMLAVAFAIPLLCACSQNEPYVMSYKEYGITEKQYVYWMSYYKTTFLNSFIEYGLVDKSAYTEDFWQNAPDGGQTFYEMTVARAEGYMKTLVVCMYLYDEYKLGESEDAREQLEVAVDKCIAEDISSSGSRGKLNGALGEYKLNISDLEKIYEIELKKTMVEEYLYGESGTDKVTDEEREDYYEKTYVRVKHVLVNTVDKYFLNDDGERVVDPSTGYYKTEKLTDAEKAEKTALASDIYQKASNGDNFEKLIEEYNEDEGMTYYTDGYFLTSESSYEKAFLEASLQMKEGEVRRVESAYGVHIIKKYPLEERAYEKELNKNFFTDMESEVLSLKKEAMYAKHEITVQGCTLDIFKGYALMPEILL